MDGRIYSSKWSGLSIRPTIALILPSTLRLIRDDGNKLYNCINAQGYNESEDNIQAVSGIAEDIRDALLDYQVGDSTARTTFGKLNWDTLTDHPAARNIRSTLRLNCELPHL